MTVRFFFLSFTAILCRTTYPPSISYRDMTLRRSFLGTRIRPSGLHAWPWDMRNVVKTLTMCNAPCLGLATVRAIMRRTGCSSSLTASVASGSTWPRVLCGGMSCCWLGAGGWSGRACGMKMCRKWLSVSVHVRLHLLRVPRAGAR